jgi:hypothetical protein
MDITSDVTYRGLLLTGAAGGAGGNNPVEGIRLTRARYGDVTVHGYTEKKSLDDGMDASDVFLGQRQVVLSGEVYAKSKAGLFDLLDILRLKFTPTDAYNEAPRDRGFLPLYFSQPTSLLDDWPLGVIPRELRCRPTAQPEHDIQFAALGGATAKSDPEGGYVVPFVLRLEAKDPRFYGVEDIISYFDASAGVVGVEIINRGNYPAPVNFVLGYSGTGAKTFTLVGMGTNMTVTIPAGPDPRTVLVDGVAKVCTLNIGTAETLRMDLVVFAAGTTWPRVMPTPAPADPVLFDWTFVGGGLDTGSRVFFREAWA